MTINTDNCWKTIGVWGNQTPRCPELDRVIHCRDCDVFSKAGRGLLERELPQDYVSERTELLARKKEVGSLEVMSAVIFRIVDEWLAVTTGIVQEVSDIRPVHHIPYTNIRKIKGIVFIRGELHICVSIGGLLGILKGDTNKEQDTQIDYTQRLIIISNDGQKFVFPANEILGTQRISLNELKSVPSTFSNSMSSFISNIFEFKGRTVGLLDEQRVMDGLKESLT